VTKLIYLGIEVADVHRRYARIHGLLFGLGSYRLLLDVLSGRPGTTYRKARRALNAVECKLESLQVEVVAVSDADCPTRGGTYLRDTLVEYGSTLGETIRELRQMCKNLADDEPEYRHCPDAGLSRFNQDQAKYDDCKSRLERLGTLLNRLFSTY
jgi:hypothetical protein